MSVVDLMFPQPYRAPRARSHWFLSLSSQAYRDAFNHNAAKHSPCRAMKRSRSGARDERICALLEPIIPGERRGHLMLFACNHPLILGLATFEDNLYTYISP